MKTATVKSDSVIEIRDLPIPTLNPGDVLVKMQSCGICGSDVEKVFGKYGQPSMKLGHEPAGIVLEVGTSVKDFKPGDRVFTHHHVACYSDSCHECSHGNETMCPHYYTSNLDPCGLSEQYVVPEWNVSHGGILKIPDSMSFAEAAMIEPLACCVRAWKKFEHHSGDTAVVLGVGPTGMMHVLLAKSFGFEKIFCVDLNDYRLDYVKQFQVQTLRSDDSKLIEKIKFDTDGVGVDVVIVATGNLSAFKDALHMVRKGGIVMMFGVPSKGDTIDIDMSTVYSREVSILTTFAASDLDTKDALSLMSEKKINVKQLITHKYGLEQSQKAFEHAKTGEKAMKIIIEN